MWKDHPEKVCAFTEEFAGKNPKTVLRRGSRVRALSDIAAELSAI